MIVLTEVVLLSLFCFANDIKHVPFLMLYCAPGIKS